MKYPKFLSDIGTIGFAAPSFGCNVEPYKSRLISAVSRFKKWGHPVMLGPNCFLGEGIGISNTPDKCGRELTDLYCSRDNDILLSCGGGELMCETIDFVDWERVGKAAPKWYCGYSDNTNFTFLLTTLCDTASVYGANGPSFGAEPAHESILDTYAFLRGEKMAFENYPVYEGRDDSLISEDNPLAPLHTIRPFQPLFFDEKGNRTDTWKAGGRLLGGCIDILTNIRGTAYDKVSEFAERYREDGILWFFEDCELNPMAIRRTLWAMKHTGWFRHVKGFLIGRPMNEGEEYCGLGHEEAVVGTLKELGVPIAYGLDFGHLPPHMPIVCGAVAEAEGSGQSFRITYDFR